jgi:hypothetical protein
VEFLVVAENKPCYQWQIELLIESFKLLNLQEKLHVFLIGKSQKLFCKNIDQHENCTYLEDKSYKYGFNYFNFYEALISFKEKNLDKNISIIDPDCLFIKNDFSNVEDKNIFYQMEIVKNDITENIFNNLFNFKLQQICSFLFFSNKIDLNFFKKSLIFTEQLIVEILKRKLDQRFINNNIFKYGLVLNAIFENIPINTSYSVINFPQDNSNKFNFLSYKHDIKPFFNKNDFMYDKESPLIRKHLDPFTCLAELPDFPNCLPIKKIAESYKGQMNEV